MGAKIERMSDEMMQTLKESGAADPGKCYENCVIAVLGLRASRKLQYMLGFVRPLGYSPVPHAWLGQETPSGLVYLDPTLQSSSPLWHERKDEFIYKERYSFTREQLLLWFRASYPDHELDETGIPTGPIKGPTINAIGELTQQPPR